MYVLLWIQSAGADFLPGECSETCFWKPASTSVRRCIVQFPFLLLSLLATALRADTPPKIFVFMAGSEPERISGQGIVGTSQAAIELTRTAPSYDIESMRTFSRHCPSVVMTTGRDKADVLIRVERDDPNPTTPFVKANRIAVFNSNDELVYATRARLLSNASKDACRAILDFLKR